MLIVLIFRAESFTLIMKQIFLLIIVFACALTTKAQFQRDSFDVYAITNARIVTVSGTTIDKGTVVIRGGLIEAVGANVAAPADARVIDATGLTVYPGFFDANTNVGIAAAPQRSAGGVNFQVVAAPPPTPQINQTQSNSNYPAGLQPEANAADQIRASDSSFETARNNGFTTVLSVPRERIFNGQSAIVNTAGDSVSAMIVRSPVALHVSFVTIGGGSFPSSLMGTFAALRQMLLDAQRLQSWQKIYAADPRGVRRPDNDKSLEALFPVLNGTMPIVFNADTERQLERALDLAQEFKLKAIIAGGTESWKVADRLKAQNVPVLLSLNFPKRTTSAATEADPETLATLRLRIEVPKNAARLKQAGVRFAFQSGGAANLGDFWTNAGKTVENGLSKDDALRAMTLNAAEIFGVDKQLGSIEKGKIANLTIARGDIFDKNRAFTHVFVDGKMFELKPTPKTDEKKSVSDSTKPAAAASNLSGTWTLNIEIPGQPTQATLVLTQQDDKLSGSLQSPFGNNEIKGSATAEGFNFSVTITLGQTFDVIFNGKATGNQMSGTVTSPQGTATFTGAKNP
jgi:imidazolonepropionase-like amidohydrolase